MKINSDLGGVAPPSTLNENVELNRLAQSYSYATRYISDVDTFMGQVLNKTVVPHQLEVQPGRLAGKKLCWLSCPYCYGGSSENTGERLNPQRMREIVNQSAHGPHGGIPKVVFAGYATDPLNYEHIDDLVEVAIANSQIVGFHTKALKISDRFINLLTSGLAPQRSYFSVSVDAGSGPVYGKVHGAPLNVTLYEKVLRNVARLSEKRAKTGVKLDMSATYLVTTENNYLEEAENFIRDFQNVGVDLLRFSFPQVPRGEINEDGTIIPSRSMVERAMEWLPDLVGAYHSSERPVLVADYDSDLAITKSRQLPCVARFVFPSIGFDGWLGHCSESAAPHFRDMALGNLAVTDFWDAFYDYHTEDFWAFMQKDYAKMCKNDCRCDRKEHAVNQLFADRTT